MYVTIGLEATVEKFMEGQGRVGMGVAFQQDGGGERIDEDLVIFNAKKL